MKSSYPRPLVTVDVVLLTLLGGELHFLLARRESPPHEGEWTLPGGWVHPEEDDSTLASARRILQAKAGVISPYLEQLQAFSGPSRDSRGWSVSIAYYALVPADLTAPTPAPVKWFPVADHQPLLFDHKEILQAAVARLRSKTMYSSLPCYLMPEQFTLTQLQRVYESVLGGSLDKRSFRRRIEELELLQEVPGQVAIGGHRPAQLFQLMPSAYEGITFLGRVFDVTPSARALG